jgi:hypothetical protein
MSRALLSNMDLAICRAYSRRPAKRMAVLVHSEVVSRRLEQGVLDGGRLLSARPLSPVSPPPMLAMVRRGPLNQGMSMRHSVARTTGSFAPSEGGRRLRGFIPPLFRIRENGDGGPNRITTVAVDGSAWVCPCSPRSGSLGLGTEGTHLSGQAWSCCQGCRRPCSR